MSRPPAGVLGTPVPLQVVVVRDEKLVVAVTGFVAYPEGLELTVTVRTPEGVDLPADPGAFGLEIGFADGRVAGSAGTTARERSPELCLERTGGTSDEGRGDLRFWLSPMPPRGRLTVTVAWPDQGVAPTRVVVDGSPLVEAAGRAETLW